MNQDVLLKKVLASIKKAKLQKNELQAIQETKLVETFFKIFNAKQDCHAAELAKEKNWTWEEWERTIEIVLDHLEWGLSEGKIIQPRDSLSLFVTVNSFKKAVLQIPRYKKMVKYI